MIDLKKTAIGIELGSTRIKAVLIDERHVPVASVVHEWENQLVNGVSGRILSPYPAAFAKITVPSLGAKIRSRLCTMR